MPFMRKEQKTRINAGERKRQELTGLVKQTLGIKNRLKFRDVKWDPELFEGKLSCGYLILIRDGNVMSFYTPTQRKKCDNFSNFKTVEISVFNRKYNELAFKIGGRLTREGYTVGMTDIYC